MPAKGISMSYFAEKLRGVELLRSVTDAHVFLECTDRIMADVRSHRPATFPSNEEIEVMRREVLSDLRSNPAMVEKGARTMRLAMQRQCMWDQMETAHGAVSLKPLINQLDALPYINLNATAAQGR